MTKSAIDYARAYVSRRLQVIPLHYPTNQFVCPCGNVECQSPAKHPVGRLVPNGIKNAAIDADVVERWFRDQPWNIGIVTGLTSGIFALDVDPRHGGDNSIADLENKHGPLPPTWRFLTGGGGEHILFRHPGGLVPNSAGKIGVGIDVRGDAGYIVGPPSQHISGRPYAISVDHHPDDVTLAEPPPWLNATVRGQSGNGNGAQVKDWRHRGGATIPEGERNDTIARFSGHLLGRNVDPHVCLDLMLAFNATHCIPPLSEEEVLTTVASITRRELAKRLSGRCGGSRHV